MKSSFASKALILSLSIVAPILMTACGDSTGAEDDSQVREESSSSEAIQPISSTEIQVSSSSSMNDVAGSSQVQAASSSSVDEIAGSSQSQDASSSSMGLVTPSESFTDSRDGKVYKLTKIGTQTWMAEDLNYGDSSKYDMSDAFNSCPEGFHLPTLKEFQNLVDYVGGLEVASKKLKSTTGWPADNQGDWNGSDDYGFNAKPFSSGDGKGTDQNYWTSTRNYGNYYTADIFKFNPHPSSRRDPYINESMGQFCGSNLFHPSSKDEACFINVEPETKISVRCMSDIVDCGGTSIKSDEKFCQDGVAYDYCRGRIYDASKYECRQGALYNRSTDSLYKYSWVFLNDQIEYGLFKDTRDNQVYKTVTIEGITWFAENLNYALEGSHCFNNEEYYCDMYGRLYTQKQTINKTTSEDEVHYQGVCPPGSRLSTFEEYETLFTRSKDYRDYVLSSYAESDYESVFEFYENDMGFSMALGGQYDGTFLQPETPYGTNWYGLNEEGCYRGSDYIDNIFFWVSFSSNPNGYDYNNLCSIRCIVE